MFHCPPLPLTMVPLLSAWAGGCNGAIERPDPVVLLSALSAFGSGQSGRRKAPSLSALQMIYCFVRDAKMTEVSASTALVAWHFPAWWNLSICQGGQGQYPWCHRCFPCVLIAGFFSCIGILSLICFVLN